MPYQTNADTPADVRRRHSGRCLTIWREVFNDTLDRHNDEGRAFATAETAAKQCEASKAMNAVKFADGSDNIVEGLAIPFGGPLAGKDRHGEDFGPDTDLALDWFPNEGRPALYQHGLDDALKTTVVGRQIEREPIDEGHWVKVQLDKRNRHYASLQKLISDGALSFSSGAVPHLVQTRKDGHIERWPWVELSFTPTPANDYAGVYAVKTADAIEHIAAAKAEVPDALKEAIEYWAGTEPDLPERMEAVSAEVNSYLDRTAYHAGVRAKAGRTLSAANRARLARTIEAGESLAETLAALRELLQDTDPDKANQAAKDLAVLERVRFERLRAQALGVQL